MKKYLLLITSLIILGGCALGVYDGRGFHGAVIAVPHPHYEPYYPDGHSYSYGYKHYPYASGLYYRTPGYPDYYR